MDASLTMFTFVLLKYLFFMISICVLLNPKTVYSVFCLILVFLVVAALAILGGAVFVGFILVVVYVGSVLIFFLFVTMMLDLRVTVRFDFKIFFSIFSLVTMVLAVECLNMFLMEGSFSIVNFQFMSIIFSQPNIVIIGYVLYTWYAFSLILCAFILFIAMIGTIVLLTDVRLASQPIPDGVLAHVQDIGSQVITQDFSSIELRMSAVFYELLKLIFGFRN